MLALQWKSQTNKQTRQLTRGDIVSFFFFFFLPVLFLRQTHATCLDQVQSQKTWRLKAFGIRGQVWSQTLVHCAEMGDEDTPEAQAHR